MALLAGCQGSSGRSEDGTAEDSEAETVQIQEGELPVSEKKALLLVSFGTSYSETREKTIERIAQNIAMIYPEYQLRQAYTSQMVIDKVRASTEDFYEIDNVEEAMQKLADEGFGTLIVQPTHVMAGLEYDKMCEIVNSFTDRFETMVIGKPLLSDADDYQAVVQAFSSEMIPYDGMNTSIVLMGHGTEHSSNAVYSELQSTFEQMGMNQYYVGTVEAEPGLDEILGRIKESDTTKVVLVPLMIVAGDHAVNDMAGDGEDSWKTQFEAAGYEVECVVRGMGEYMIIQDLFSSHVQDSVNSLSK